MKQYNINHPSKETFDNGHEQEGYEKLLSYNLWLTLCKVALTQPKMNIEVLNIDSINSIKELKDFVEKCENLQFETFDTDYDIEEGCLNYFNIVCKKQTFEKKSVAELQSEYYDYANRIIKNNQRAWRDYKANLEKEKTEFEQYLKLKEKYEGLK